MRKGKRRRKTGLYRQIRGNEGVANMWLEQWKWKVMEQLG
jgi:hypothetical protein